MDDGVVQRSDIRDDTGTPMLETERNPMGRGSSSAESLYMTSQGFAHPLVFHNGETSYALRSCFHASLIIEISYARHRCMRVSGPD